jgi:hypothetical protein
VRFLERFHIPPPLGSAVLLIVLLTTVVAGLFLLSGPATEWLRRLPESYNKVESKVRAMADKANKLSKAAETVEHLTESEEEVPKVELKKPGLVNTFWDSTKGALTL